MSGQSIVTQAEYMQHHMTNLQLNLHNFTLGNGGFWTLNLDSLAVSIILGSLFILLFVIIAHRISKPASVPGKWQNAIELAVEAIDKTVQESSQGRADTRLIAPMALTIFLWVFLMNFMDIVPVDLLPRVMNWVGVEHFRAVPTADPTLTFAMSISVFVLIIFYNLKTKGFFGLGKEILSKPFGWYLIPVNIFFRLIEECVKPISLSLRLFGNLLAGEIVFILIAMLPWYAQLPLGLVWTLFHVLVIIIQAFIFMMLTVIYLSMAQETH